VVRIRWRGIAAVEDRRREKVAVVAGGEPLEQYCRVQKERDGSTRTEGEGLNRSRVGCSSRDQTESGLQQ
jgi:hypothetical protein